MSQVAFVHRRREVVAGYDNDEFFLDVFEGPGSIVWSNLTDFDSTDRHSTHRLRRQLEAMGIPTPDGFWELVEAKDNLTTRYEWNGSRWSTGRKLTPTTIAPPS